jgi:seryl-tRNA synthetase
MASTLITGLLALIAKYPVQFIVGAVLVAAMAGSFFYGKTVGTKKEAARLESVIAKKDKAIGMYQELEAARTKRIKELEESTKVAGDEAERTINALNASIKANATKYAKDLAAERKKRSEGNQTVTVVNPETKDTVQVTLEGAEVICSRFSDAFASSVNEQVEVSNKKGESADEKP